MVYGECRLKELRPDVIVTQDQCEVCAVSFADVEAAVRDWVGASVRVVTLRPDSLDDVFTDVRRVAEALDAPEAGEALTAQMRRRMAAVEARARSQDTLPTVACVEWIEPLMAAGNWMPELVSMAGGENLFGTAGRPAPWMSFEDLQAADPDVIAVLPCGFDRVRTRAEMGPLTSRPGWEELSAVGAGRVYVTDGNQYFNRPGPRLAESLEIMAELLHPGVFDFGHQGVGWEKL